MTVKTLHQRLSILLCLFIPLHLVGHLAALGGQVWFDRVQAMLRPVYRNPVVEPILLTAVLVQALLGLALLWNRGRRGWRPGLTRWQSLSGLILSLFILQHIPAMLAARHGAGLDTTFWWPASVASTWPFAIYFWPYYALGVAAFGMHLGIGLSFLLRRRGKAAAAVWAIRLGALGGVALGLAILAGISGVLHPVALPPEWRAYLAALWPV